MILIFECIINCFIFGGAIVGSVLYNKEFWIKDYSTAVQQKYIELHPEYNPDVKSQTTVGLLIKKILGCILFVFLLLLMVWLAGARTFLCAFLYSYVIFFVVNLFDLLVLDMGILAHWKKARLEGTEEMDAEYRANYKKCFKDFLSGLIIGIVVSLIVGGVVYILFS